MRKVRCPICKKETEWAEENIFRPFCSERCSLTDLGEWASGKRSIPSDHINDDAADEAKSLVPRRENDSDSEPE